MMVLGWRRAFCTSIPRDGGESTTSTTTAAAMAHKDKHEKSINNTDGNCNDTITTPKFGSRFSFFSSNSSSNPSTPRLQSQPVSSPSLRCRTTTTTATVPSPTSVPVSPKLQCKTRNSPRFFQRSSNPSSPRSPSTFSLLKSSLRLSRNRCGICLQRVKRGQGMAIYTAECSHSFHFPCIAVHVKKQGSLACPVCSTMWKDMPLFSVNDQNEKQQLVEEEERAREKLATRFMDNLVEKKNELRKQHLLRPDLKVYNDDEPLASLTPKARFNPIPESDENCDEEFQGFYVNGGGNSQIDNNNSGTVKVRLSPEVAMVSSGRNHETYAIVLKVKAPKAPERTQGRAPIDLVSVVDVSGNMTSEKLQMMKRAMRFVVSSLSSSDRLSIVAFSSYSKRLLPLRRMTTTGRRAARRIVESMAVLDGTSSASDAVKKAAKVLEDRREKNPVASILLLSYLQDQASCVSSTRYSHSHFDISLHSLKLTAIEDNILAKCVGGLLSVVVQDLRLRLGFVPGSAPAEIAAVYSYTPRPVALGSGTVKIGELCAEEERELLVELKVPSSAIGAHQVLSVRCCYRESVSQEDIYGREQALLVPLPHTVRSSAPTIQRLKNLFVATRGIAESRRLAGRNDLNGAYHMLVSARALIQQSAPGAANEFMVGLETELTELQRRRHGQAQTQQLGRDRVEMAVAYVDEKGEPLTPTSAWRVAEKLAKVAMMRKSLNRVSDLHGFEDARF